MTVYGTTLTILHYTFLPLTTTFNILLIVFAPLIHVISILLHSLLLPLRLLAKLETLYIFFSTAALIGLLTGLILHTSSHLLTSLFNLQSSTSASPSTHSNHTHAKKQLSETAAWQESMSLRSEEARARLSLAMHAREYGEMGMGNGKGGRLGKETILEEEDDSEDGF